MASGDLIELTRQAVWQTLLIGGPLLGIVLLVGLLVSALQAATHVHDATVSLVPKLLVCGVLLALGLPWIAARLADFSRPLFSEPPVGGVSSDLDAR